MPQNIPNGVELRPAFTWCCEACGRENYRTLFIVPSHVLDNWNGVPVYEQENRQAGLEIWPQTVCCKYCGNWDEVNDVY